MSNVNLPFSTYYQIAQAKGVLIALIGEPTLPATS